MQDHFNPRSREGSDRDRIDRYRRQRMISIHAPVKGATEKLLAQPKELEFQSTLP